MPAHSYNKKTAARVVCDGYFFDKLRAKYPGSISYHEIVEGYVTNRDRFVDRDDAERLKNQVKFDQVYKKS